MVLLIVVFLDKQIAGDVAKNEDDLLIIPVKVHKIVDERGAYTTSRSDQEVLELFEGVNRIWVQGRIYFQVEEIVESDVSFEAIPNAINGNYLELFNHPNLNHGVINVFFVQSLNGLNGQTLIHINSVMIADDGNVMDYRTAAHEIGHLFGLKHIDFSDSLMMQGKNGELLSNGEIELARKNALEFSKSSFKKF